MEAKGGTCVERPRLRGKRKDKAPYQCPRLLSRRRRPPGRATAKQHSHHRPRPPLGRETLQRPSRIGAVGDGVVAVSGLALRQIGRVQAPTVTVPSPSRHCRDVRSNQCSRRISSEEFCTNAAIISPMGRRRGGPVFLCSISLARR